MMIDNLKHLCSIGWTNIYLVWQKMFPQLDVFDMVEKIKYFFINQKKVTKQRVV